MENRVKIWVGLGAFLLANTSAVAIAASEHAHHGKAVTKVAGVESHPAHPQSLSQAGGEFIQ